jgi:hypothetical protein
MVMATVKEEHKYGKGSTEAFSDLKNAISRMGKILNDDPGTLSIEGKVKYGLGAATKVKAMIQQEGDESIISFESKGGDIAGRAGRENIKRLLETMTKIDDPDFDVTKADKQQWGRVGYFALGGVGVLIILLVIMVNPSLVNDNRWVIIFLAAVYMWGFTKIGKK